MSPFWRQRWFALVLSCVKAALAVGLLAWVAHSVDLRQAGDTLSRLAPAAAILAVAMLALQSLLAAWRWSLVSAQIGSPLPLMPALKLFMVSLFYNQALPSTIPGDAVRVVGAAKCGSGIGPATLGVLIDRVLTLFGLLLLAVLGQVALQAIWRSDIGIPFFFEATALAVFAIPCFVALGLLAPGLAGRLGAGSRVEALSLAATRLLKDPRTLGFVGLTLVIHGLSIVAVYLLSKGMGLALSLTETAVVLPAVLLIAQLPISVGGWGLREGGMVLALAAFGVNATDAATLSVAFGLVQLFWGLLGGGFIFTPLRPLAAKQS